MFGAPAAAESGDEEIVRLPEIDAHRRRPHGIDFTLLHALVLTESAYLSGAVFYICKKLGWFRAVWHGHGVAAAGVHWTAVLIGVVLTTG